MPKIVQYNLPPGGTVVDLADNTSEALDIESTDAKDYITIDTTDGSESMKFGVGASSDMMRLYYNGTIDTSQADGYGIRAKTTASATEPVFIPSKNDPDTGIGRADADQLSLIAGGVEVARCVTTNADAEFLMADEVGFINDPDLMMRRKSTNSLEFRVAGTDILGIDANGSYVENGKFGVGTLSPSAPIHIVDDTQNTQLLIDRSTGQFKIEQNTANTTAQSNVNLRLASGNIVRMVLSSGGNVGIGTSSPAYALDVVGNAGKSVGGTAWVDTSDARIKTNVENIENALDKIAQLRPVSFNYTEEYLSVHPEIDGSKRYNSFVAQEYAEVFPDAVSSNAKLERVVTPESEGVEEVRETLIEDLHQYTPHDLTMYLVKAVQELSRKLEDAEARIGFLESDSGA